MDLTLADIVSKIASQGSNPDVSFLKDNPEAQAMLLLALLSNKNGAGTNNDATSNNSGATKKKVGRKPVTSDEEDSDNPKLKRKAQNRAAQRAFRERKENQVKVLEDKVKELEGIHLEKKEKIILENEQLKDMIKQLQEENATLLSSTVSFDVPLSKTLQDDDERPQKIKRQNTYDTSPISSHFESSSSSSHSSKSRSNTPESSVMQQPLHDMTIDDLLKDLPSNALIDHSELFGLNSLTTSQLDDFLQNQNFNFETDPSQFDFFYPILPEKKDITHVWDKYSEHPRFDEFNLDQLCDDMNHKATCTDPHYDHDKEFEKLINERYPLEN